MGSYQRGLAPSTWSVVLCIVFVFVSSACLEQRSGNAGLRAFGPPVEEGYTLKRSAGRGKEIPFSHPRRLDRRNVTALREAMACAIQMPRDL